MSTPLTRRPESDGASAQAVPAAASGAAEYALPTTVRGMGAQVAAALGLLTGVWVALSQLFLTLQYSGTNATAVNLISELAVAGLGAFALASPRGFPGLQLGSALLGIWPHRRPHVLVQQLGRRGADRPGGSRPGRRRPASARPPLTAPGVRALRGPGPAPRAAGGRALTPAPDHSSGAPDEP